VITFRDWAIKQSNAFREPPMVYIGVCMIFAGLLAFPPIPVLMPFWTKVFGRNWLLAAAISFWGGWAVAVIGFKMHKAKSS
jgi:hypothetical protein